MDRARVLRSKTHGNICAKKTRMPGRHAHTIATPTSASDQIDGITLSPSRCQKLALHEILKDLEGHTSLVKAIAEINDVFEANNACYTGPVKVRY